MSDTEGSDVADAVAPRVTRRGASTMLLVIGTVGVVADTEIVSREMLDVAGGAHR